MLLALSVTGLSAIIFGGFLDFAPNRLARATAHSLWQAPRLEAATAIAGVCALALLSFAEARRVRSIATILSAALILWASLAGAGRFATLLTGSAPPAARASLGAAFWILGGVAVLAIADAVQREEFGLRTRLAIAAGFLAGFLLMAAAGDFDTLSLAREFANSRSVFVSELIRHLGLVGVTIFFALITGVPLTILVLRRAAMAGVVFTGLGVLQTIPSIALFGALIAPMSKLGEELAFLRDLGISGTGPAPAVIALTLYSLLPLVRSFHTGFAEVAPEIKEAAAAMGFGWRKAFIEVELPLALPALLAGLRVVAIQAIGLATIAALIGAGGLGTFVFQGIGQYALDLVLVGAIPIILLALLTNFIFEMLLSLARRNR